MRAFTAFFFLASALFVATAHADWISPFFIGVARFDLNKGFVEVEESQAQLALGNGSMAYGRETCIGICLGGLFAGKKKAPLLEHTYIRLLGNPDDLGIHMWGFMCNPKTNTTMGIRRTYQGIRFAKGELSLDANWQMGAEIVASVILADPGLASFFPERSSSQTKWIHSACDKNSLAGKKMSTFQMTQVAPKDDTGIFTQKYFERDGNRYIRFTWTASTWKDAVEKEAEAISLELKHLLQTL